MSLISLPNSAGRTDPLASAVAILQNVVVGLTVSFVALSLGAALGVLSGRGAFAGMLSAGVFAIVTSCLGGTRIQCSGPTAPMSAVTATIVAAAHERLPAAAGLSADHFVNLVLLVAGGLLLLMALLRLGRFISLVPNVVVSGFMSGIALLIWLDQLQSIFGFGDKRPIGGPVHLNLLVAAATVAAIFLFAPLTRKVVGSAARFLPATLFAIAAVSLVCNLAALPVAHLQLNGGFSRMTDLGSLLAAQWPQTWSPGLVASVFPFALQLALLCYLDTLLTSLVIDKMSGEPTRQDRELLAQGVANGAVALLGGIPGAQATIRSVLMLKENASLRLAGIMVGVFVLLEMILLQDALGLIPQAVFAGILFKVGYDVFDFQPLRLYCRQFVRQRGRLFADFFSRHDDESVFVTNREMLMIFGTSAVTLGYGLNAAVGGFTILFYLHNRVFNRENPMRDLRPTLETEVFARQN